MKSLRRAVALSCLIFSLHVFALTRQPASDYRARRVHLAEKLNGGVAVLFAATQPQLDFMLYRQDPDFYYLTGWNEPGAALFIQSGMVFTFEPGIYIPEEKIGVRIEDVFYASPSGKLVSLTCALPKDADEAEGIMKQGK